MTFEDLEISIRKNILAVYGSSLPVILGNQVPSAGRVDEGIYFWQLSVARYGHQIRTYHDAMPHVDRIEIQLIEAMYQISVLHKEALNVITDLSLAMQSMRFIRLMRADNIGVQRISNILSPAIINDRDQYEYNPNFTVVFSFEKIFDDSDGSVNCKNVRLIGV